MRDEYRFDLDDECECCCREASRDYEADYDDLMEAYLELEQENEDLKTTIKVMSRMIGTKYE